MSAAFSASLILAASHQPGWSLKSKTDLKKSPERFVSYLCVLLCPYIYIIFIYIYDYRIIHVLYSYIYTHQCGIGNSMLITGNGPHHLQAFRIHCHQLDWHPPHPSSLAQFGIQNYSLHHCTITLHAKQQGPLAPSELQAVPKIGFRVGRLILSIKRYRNTHIEAVHLVNQNLLASVLGRWKCSSRTIPIPNRSKLEAACRKDGKGLSFESVSLFDVWSDDDSIKAGKHQDRWRWSLNWRTKGRLHGGWGSIFQGKAWAKPWRGAIL